MTTMSAGRLRRQIRRVSNVRRWTLRQKIGVGAWIPVLIVALALFTGPNRSSSAASAPTTSTTFAATVLALEPIVPAALSKAGKTSVRDRVIKWVNGVPPRRSPVQQLAIVKWRKAHRNAGSRAGVTVVIRHPVAVRRTAGH